MHEVSGSIPDISRQYFCRIYVKEAEKRKYYLKNFLYLVCLDYLYNFLTSFRILAKAIGIDASDMKGYKTYLQSCPTITEYVTLTDTRSNANTFSCLFGQHTNSSYQHPVDDPMQRSDGNGDYDNI
jgi:hypothetical protein